MMNYLIQISAICLATVVAFKTVIADNGDAIMRLPIERKTAGSSTKH